MRIRNQVSIVWPVFIPFSPRTSLLPPLCPDLCLFSCALPLPIHSELTVQLRKAGSRGAVEGVFQVLSHMSEKLGESDMKEKVIEEDRSPVFYSLPCLTVQ